MKKVLIIGAGSAAHMVAKEIIFHKETSQKFRIVGFLDDDGKKTSIGDIPVLGRIDDAQKVINELGIEEVIIAIPSASRAVINRIVGLLSGLNVKIKIVPGIYEIIEGNVSLKQIRDIEPADLLGREEVGFDIEKLSPYYEGRTVFISGAGGSIGSELLLQLLKLPVKKIVGMGHGENSIHELINKVSVNMRFDYVIGDVKDFEKLEYDLNKIKPDIFFHAAAHKHVPLMEKSPDEAVHNNIIGTYNSAMASIRSGVKKFVLISTDKAVNPTSIMGATKRVAERIVLSMDRIFGKTSFSLTRFGNVLSSRGSVVPIFINQIKEGGPVTITHPDITRFFMSIPEAARLVIKSATIDEGKIFVLDMGEPVKILDLAKTLIKFFGYNENEIPVVFTGLRPGEKMHEEVLTENELLQRTYFEKLLISSENGDILDRSGLEKMMSDFGDAVKKHDKKLCTDTLRSYVPEMKNGGHYE